MSRRSHKKSRNGCLECKRRHMRCDENQPICTNCTTAEIRCSYMGTKANATYYIASTFSINPAPGTSTSTHTTPAPTPTPCNENSLSIPESVDPYNLNMTHLELFNNIYSTGFRSFEESGYSNIIIPISIYIKHASKTPYLMHQVLATSALHLSTQSVESQKFYRKYATGLQIRALSLFNASNPVLTVTSENCVQMFLFSSLVGVHLLCEILLYQRSNLDDFINAFTHCLGVYRGVLAVIGQCEHLLHEKELEPGLKMSQVLHKRMEACGSECDALQHMIDSREIDESSKKAYHESILHLQQAFDALNSTSGSRTQLAVVIVWPILILPKFVDLLNQRRPEALIVLAYYAVLLHRGRDIWFVGQGGRFLIESIGLNLDYNWQELLRFPNESLREETIN